MKAMMSDTREHSWRGEPAPVTQSADHLIEHARDRKPRDDWQNDCPAHTS
jgi:hypothetical protein